MNITCIQLSLQMLKTVLLLSLLFVSVTSAANKPISQVPINTHSKRVALVIGNSRYNIGNLKNPENDAQAVRNALTALGFEVDYFTNLDQKSMVQQVFDFFHHKASLSELRLVYYAGHGIQFEGKNYLIPTDANLGLPSEIPHTGYMLDELRRSLDGLQQGASIIILDTCRVTICPVGQCRGVLSSLGLSNERKSSGTLIAYSTGPGQLASDGGENEHSLYTQVLLELLSTPGQPVEKLFRKLTEEVFHRSGGLQKPEFVDGLMGAEICLKAGLLEQCP
ncbi:caspase family protein [Methyloglobulus sp.]|uniref:caspase family protein n=1 Tax=Methyloglobulus sp. TaxID=2518622 RepID=UPI0032B80963